MTRRPTPLHVIALVGLALAGTALFAAAADVSPPEIGWTMVGTDMVRFQLHFANSSTTEPTLTVHGEMYSQPFGAFLPHYGLIGVFDVPPIEPESFFDVFFEVPLASLPPNPAGGGGGGGGASLASVVLCPPPMWVGNVDVNWSGPGGAGQVNAHYGDVGVCPGGPASCLHVMTMCPVPMPWAFVINCPGWTVSLLNEDYSPAPAMLPAGWTGWICISANAGIPVGAQCCFALNLVCQGVPATINVCAYACECPVKTEHGTWGRLKTMYR
jgi:hypothetical protein